MRGDGAVAALLDEDLVGVGGGELLCCDGAAEVLVGVRKWEELGVGAGELGRVVVPGLDLGCEGHWRGEVLGCCLGDHRALGD